MSAKISTQMEDLAKEIMELHAKLKDPTAELMPMTEVMRLLETANSRTRRLCREIIEAQTKTPREERIRTHFVGAAKIIADHVGGYDLEVDDDARLSMGDKGAFVEAWLWVSGSSAAVFRSQEKELSKNREAARAKEKSRV